MILRVSTRQIIKQINDERRHSFRQLGYKQIQRPGIADIFGAFKYIISYCSSGVIMEGITITKDSTSEDLEPIAMAIYSAVGLPVTMKSKNNNGIRIENNQVIDYNYTGKYLEMAIEQKKTIHGFA